MLASLRSRWGSTESHPTTGRNPPGGARLRRALTADAGGASTASFSVQGSISRTRLPKSGPPRHPLSITPAKGSGGPRGGEFDRSRRSGSPSPDFLWPRDLQALFRSSVKGAKGVRLGKSSQAFGLILDPEADHPNAKMIRRIIPAPVRSLREKEIVGWVSIRNAGTIAVPFGPSCCAAYAACQSCSTSPLASRHRISVGTTAGCNASE